MPKTKTKTKGKKKKKKEMNQNKMMMTMISLNSVKKALQNRNESEYGNYGDVT